MAPQIFEASEADKANLEYACKMMDEGCTRIFDVGLSNADGDGKHDARGMQLLKNWAGVRTRSPTEPRLRYCSAH